MSEVTWRKESLERLDALPALAWLVTADTRTSEYRALVGARVELASEWAIEGVWDGPFQDGEFDETAQVYGSGFRVRADRMVFVSPATTTERIWYAREGVAVHVSNSLPLLLARTGLRLRDDVPNYAALSAASPADPCEDCELPADAGPIHVLAHHNLVVGVDDPTPRRVAKPRNRAFSTFEQYDAFLRRTADAISANALDEGRQHLVKMLTTVSSGYDSPAAAVFARRMGCTDAVTIKKARSTVPRSDSGASVAQQLGLACTEYPRGRAGSESELSFWAALGIPQDEHFAVFDYPGPVCLLFTGQYGGNIWDLDVFFRSPFEHDDWSGLGLGEYRLQSSVIHCPVPYWGSDRCEDVLAIGRSEAMKPWVRHGQYHRPVPRRLVEEAGVAPTSFGMRKSATHYEGSFFWPRDPDLSADFGEFLESRHVPVPPIRLARLWSAVYDHLVSPIGERVVGRNPREFWTESRRLAFVWANEGLARQYGEALSSVSVTIEEVSEVGSGLGGFQLA